MMFIPSVDILDIFNVLSLTLPCGWVRTFRGNGRCMLSANILSQFLRLRRFAFGSRERISFLLSDSHQ
jgi:hypothetical protein